jgi:hypothetical protein
MKLSEFAQYGPTDNVTQIVLEALAHLAKPYAKTRTLELEDGMPFVDEVVDGTFRFGADGIRIKGTGPTSGFTINPKSITTGTNYGLFNTWGHSKCTLEDFAIDGQRASILLKAKIGNSFFYVADGSIQTRMRRMVLTNLADTPDGEGFATLVSGKASDFAAEDCNISSIAGSGFNLCGDKIRISRCTIENCDWNSASIFGGRRVVFNSNILRLAKKRNLNMENSATDIVVTSNIFEGAGYANIGNYDSVDCIFVAGNMFINAGNGATFPVGELDFTGTGRIKIGHNFYAPKAGGYQLRTSGATPNLVLGDSEITKILRQ